jgi:hypothetical protein
MGVELKGIDRGRALACYAFGLLDVDYFRA